MIYFIEIYLKIYGGRTLLNLLERKASWMYRWSMPSDLHQSGMGTDVEGRPNILGVLSISKKIKKKEDSTGNMV
jgi:hypothetical protein